MVKETDFKWKIRHANNIPTNPVQSKFCIVDLGDGKGNLCMVESHYPQNTDGLTNQETITSLVNVNGKYHRFAV